MFRQTIRATERTDVDSESAKLRAQCTAANVPISQSAVLVAEVEAGLLQLVTKARELAAIGSQIEAARQITGKGYSVKLILSGNQRRTLLQRLWASIRGH